MAAQISIFSLYEFYEKLSQEKQYLILNTTRPGYANYNADHESLSLEIDMAKRVAILEEYKAIKRKSHLNLEFIGELNSSPVGDLDFRTTPGFSQVTACYVYTSYGFPWIILGAFSNIPDFFKSIIEDEDLASLGIQGVPQIIDATLLKEEDFNLTKIRHYNVSDLRNI